MTDEPSRRTDTGSRVIHASPSTIYRAFLDAEAVACWRPPAGMKARIYAFDPREGGTYRMAFVYADADHSVAGKTSEHVDQFRGRFVALVPNERIVEQVEFESNDPAFAGAMTIVTTLVPVEGGTKVTVECRDVPEGIKASDHEAGIASSLRNLALLTE